MCRIEWRGEKGLSRSDENGLEDFEDTSELKKRRGL